MKTKEKLIFRTIGRIHKESTERTRTTKILSQIIGYSLGPTDVPSAVKFMATLCQNDHEAALQAYMASHSLRQIREACEFVRTMTYRLDD